jgi:DNA-binding XRE family transcriptional regulator
MKNNIRVNRATNKISQDDLAKLVGVSRQTINAIENNKYYWYHPLISGQKAQNSLTD